MSGFLKIVFFYLISFSDTFLVSTHHLADLNDGKLAHCLARVAVCQPSEAGSPIRAVAADPCVQYPRHTGLLALMLSAKLTLVSIYLYFLHFPFFPFL